LWDDRAQSDAYLVPVQITTLLPNIVQAPPPPGPGCSPPCSGGGGGGGGGGSGSSTPTTLPTQGTMTIVFDQTLRLERQAFNAILGVTPNATLTNAAVRLTILDSVGADASSKF